MNMSLKVLKGEVGARLEYFIHTPSKIDNTAVIDELERFACRIDQLILANNEKETALEERLDGSLRFGSKITTDEPIYKPTQFKHFYYLIKKFKPTNVYNITHSYTDPMFIISKIDEETLTYRCPYWKDQTEKTVSFHSVWLSWLSHDLQNLFIKIEECEE